MAYRKASWASRLQGDASGHSIVPWIAYLPRSSNRAHVSIQNAVDSLYEIAVTQGKATSTRRLDRLARFCVDELARRGLRGAVTEAKLPGGGREKSWDVAWSMANKPRLAISLKSLLRNLGGTVPNRADDMIGEVTNVQMYSPEIVTGYIMVFNVAEDALSPLHGCSWSELLRRRITRLSGRRPPSWSIGMIEAALFIEVDFSTSPRLVSGVSDTAPFFDRLVAAVRNRNPALERRA